MNNTSNPRTARVIGFTVAWFVASALGTAIGFLLFSSMMRPSYDRILWLWSVNGLVAAALQWGVLRIHRVDSPGWFRYSALSWIAGGIGAWALAKLDASGGWVAMVPTAILLGSSQAYALRSHFRWGDLFPAWTVLTVIGLSGGTAIASALDPEPLRRLPDPDTYKLVKGAILGGALALCTMVPLAMIVARPSSQASTTKHSA